MKKAQKVENPSWQAGVSKERNVESTPPILGADSTKSNTIPGLDHSFSGGRWVITSHHKKFQQDLMMAKAARAAAKKSAKSSSKNGGLV